MTLAGDLKSFERNVYSQHGEDGVVEWVFGRVAPRHRICVEFGAWDGRALSNTFNLVASDGWRSVYIEADRRKYESLKRTATAYPAITPLCSLVTASGESSLDCILERQGVPEDFDLLSIDIDGDEYDVWEATTRFHPTMVIVEHNVSFPPEVRFIDRGGRAFMGSSAAALEELAARKGYRLLGCVGTNLFFLREAEFSVLGVAPQSVAAALDYKPPCYVFFNNAGEIVFSDRAVARQLRHVAYARPFKSWVRRALAMPTLYVLGDPHPGEGAVLKILRHLAAFSRRIREMLQPIDAES